MCICIRQCHHGNKIEQLISTITVSLQYKTFSFIFLTSARQARNYLLPCQQKISYYLCQRLVHFLTLHCLQQRWMNSFRRKNGMIENRTFFSFISASTFLQVIFFSYQHFTFSDYVTISFSNSLECLSSCLLYFPVVLLPLFTFSNDSFLFPFFLSKSS